MNTSNHDTAELRDKILRLINSTDDPEKLRIILSFSRGVLI